MIETTRLETHLIAAARRYAPALIPAGWQKPGDYPGALPDFARALATYNVLVLAGDVPKEAVKAWTDGYIDLYGLLCAALFPSYTRVSAFYLDQSQPMLVAVYGEATPVITVMAGFVAPYVVTRQGTRPLDVELFGMMDMILEELEATDLPREDYRRLRDSGAAHLRGMLEIAGRQYPITPPARPIFDAMAQHPAERVEAAAPAPPTDLPEPPADLPEPPAPPETMPEADALQPPPTLPELPDEAAAGAAAEPAPQRKFDPDAVPIFFNPAQGGNAAPPPVPPLPPR